MNCTATTRKGDPCRAKAIGGGTLCFAHGRAAEWRAAAARGGRVSPTDADENRALLRELRDGLRDLWREVRGGKVLPAVAHATCAVAGQLRQTLEASVELGELREVAARVAALEAERGLR